MADGWNYDALTQTPTATLAGDLEEVEEDEELLSESLSPYLASTQSPDGASPTDSMASRKHGENRSGEELSLAVHRNAGRLCDGYDFEATTHISLGPTEGQAGFRQTDASQTFTPSPQLGAGTTKVAAAADTRELRNALTSLRIKLPSRGARSDGSSEQQHRTSRKVPATLSADSTGSTADAGGTAPAVQSFSHSQGPAGGASHVACSPSSEVLPPSSRISSGAENTSKPEQEERTEEDARRDWGRHRSAVQQRPGGGSGGSDGDGSSFLRSMDSASSKKAPKPIKDIFAESLKVKLERDNRERLRREEVRFVKGGVLFASDGLQSASSKGKALLHRTSQGYPTVHQRLVQTQPRNEHHAAQHPGNCGKFGVVEGLRPEGGGSGSGGGEGSAIRVGGNLGCAEGVVIPREDTGVDASKTQKSVSSHRGEVKVETNNALAATKPVSSKEARGRVGWDRSVRAKATWEERTTGFGSKMLQSMGFGGPTAEPHRIENVLTFVSEQIAAQRARGGPGGGLGYNHNSPAREVPCDVDHSRVRSTRSYYQIPVAFPFEAPMAAQDQLMQRVLAALMSKRHGMFESPTGTGKSQALLCSLLAYQRWAALNTGRAPKMFYCVRTHTQQNQMIKELKKSPYRPTHATLASRTQLCVNPMVVGDGFSSEEDDVEDVHDTGRSAVRSRAVAETGAVGTGSGRGRRRGKPNRHAMQKSCETLRSKVNNQRLFNKYLNLPYGGRVLYDDSLPDVRMDRAGIAGRLPDDKMKHVGCPHWRMMSSPAFTELLHEYARPQPGLIGSDGIHDMSDDRAFGRDPKGFIEKRRAALQRPGGCGDGGGWGGGRGCVGSGGDSAPGRRFPSSATVQASSVSSSQPAVVELSYQLNSDKDGGIGVDSAQDGLERWGGACTAGDDSQEDEGPELIGCPLYANQVLAQQAQLVIVTYNYVLDPNIRSAVSLSLEGAIVIIDEAHNVEGVCRDAGSLELSVVDIANIALDLCRLSRRPTYRQDALVLLEFVMELLRFTARESGVLEEFEDGTPFVDPHGQLEEQEVTKKTWAFENAGVNFWWELMNGQSRMSHHLLVVAMSRIMEEMKNNNNQDDAVESEDHDDDLSGANMMTNGLKSLEMFLSVTTLMLNHPDDYNVNVMVWNNVKTEKLPAHTTRRPHSECPLQGSPFVRGGAVPKRMFRLNIWLMAPSVIFDEVASKAHSVILTSGTLSPLPSLEAELGRSFSKRLLPPALALEAKHVIKTEGQVRVIPVGYSPRNFVLRCTESRRSNEFLRQLGRTIAALCQHVPSGVLVFLPSYSTLRRVGTVWRACDIWRRLERIKGVIVEEPESGAEFKAARRRYEEAVDAPGGGSALLLAVYRGKMSEGVSFNDQYARGVLCVGIPFSNLGCPKINAKMHFNNWRRRGGGSGNGSGSGGGAPSGRPRGDNASNGDRSGRGESALSSAEGGSGANGMTTGEAGRRLLSGQEWYTQDAFRALNQALGRCIRHLYDYGVICLIDERYLNGRQKLNLATWVRDLPRDFTGLAEMGDTMNEFFASAPDFVQHRRVQDRKRRRAIEKAKRAAGVSTPSTGGNVRGFDIETERRRTEISNMKGLRGEGTGDLLRGSETAGVEDDDDVIVPNTPITISCSPDSNPCVDLSVSVEHSSPGTLQTRRSDNDHGFPPATDTAVANRSTQPAELAGSSRPTTPAVAVKPSPLTVCTGLLSRPSSPDVTVVDKSGGHSAKGTGERGATCEPFRPSYAPHASHNGDTSARASDRAPGDLIKSGGGGGNSSTCSSVFGQDGNWGDAGRPPEARQEADGTLRGEINNEDGVGNPFDVSATDLLLTQMKEEADALCVFYDL